MFVFFVLSRCTFISTENGVSMYEFHFKGVYKGKKVERIIGKSDELLEIKKNKEYILKLNYIYMRKTDLIGYIKKFIKLEEISH